VTPQTPMQIRMHKDKETKNSVRYSEPKKGDDPHTKNIYLTKEELQASFGGVPDELIVSIDVPITEKA